MEPEYKTAVLFLRLGRDCIIDIGQEELFIFIVFGKILLVQADNVSLWISETRWMSFVSI